MRDEICNLDDCDNFGALHCRICNATYCHDHSCRHLSHDNVSSDDNLYHLYSNEDLREKRDELFQQLKLIQHELDIRDNARAAIARENLDSWLASQGYTPRTAPKTRGRAINNNPRRVSKPSKEVSQAKRALITLREKGLLDVVLNLLKGN